MRDHWYCGNIPPRPLDDKRKDFEIGGEKKRQDKVWTNQRVFWGKMAVFFSKSREVRQKVSRRGGRGGFTIERERRGRP